MTTEEQNGSRYPLAFDTNGNPIEVPENAVGWRVRRGGGRRGRPRNVFDGETGRQLEIPLGGTLDDLIEAGCPSDRYLLYPVDRDGKIIAGIVAVTAVPESAIEEDGEEQAANPTVSHADPLVREVLASLKSSNEMLCRALEATASGYGPVRAARMQAPMIVEQPASKDEGGGFGGFKPDQITEFAKMMFTMFKNGGGPTGDGGGAAGGATGGAP